MATKYTYLQLFSDPLWGNVKSGDLINIKAEDWNEIYKKIKSRMKIDQQDIFRGKGVASSPQTPISNNDIQYLKEGCKAPSEIDCPTNTNGGIKQGDEIKASYFNNYYRFLTGNSKDVTGQQITASYFNELLNAYYNLSYCSCEGVCEFCDNCPSDGECPCQCQNDD